jgi:UDP-glucose 4-epimerase
LVENYSSEFTTVVLRIFFAYGTKQTGDRLIPRLCEMVVEGKTIVLDGQDGLRINPIHIGDVVTGFAAAVEARENLKLNLAGPEVASLRQIGEIIGRLTDRKPHFEVRRPSAQTPTLVGDISQLRERLNVNPGIGLETGLRTLVGSRGSL